MTLLAPVWLILVPLAVLAGWRWPALRLQEPLRALALVLVILVLAGLRFGGGAGRDVWVLVDQSDSAAEARERVAREWEGLLERGRGRDDRLKFVDFAESAVARERGDPGFGDARGASRLATAIRYTLTQLDPDRPSRLLVLSDGFSTEPLHGLDDALRARSAPMDLRFLPGQNRPDARVVALRTVERAAPGAAVALELDLAGNQDGPVPWEILRDGRSVSRGEAKLVRGRAVVRLSDRAPMAGTARYEARITPADDGITANNRGETWLAVAGRREVLLLSPYGDDPLGSALQSGGWNVRRLANAGDMQPGRLAGARLVILNNVLAAQCPAEFLRAIDFWVREQGGALVMVGGQSSFGSGGWFESPIDQLLPVSMELRTEHRRLATAMAITLDRSGSMAMTVAGGVAKIDLANAGAARAAQLLGDDDLLAVHAVDSEPHVVVPLSAVGPNREAIDRATRAITSGGGGIFVYNALKGAWGELQPLQGVRRHVILFADANDAEQPDDYLKLLERMREARVTVTVIGLGSDKDSDAAFLQDVAAKGGGRMFFVSDAPDLPAVFAQETVAVARAMFVEDATAVKPTAGWLEIASRPLSWLSSVDGYNLTYLRDGATAAAISGDRYSAPLVAYWQRGAGRVAAVAFPLAGGNSAAQRAWPSVGEFVRTLSRWLGGTEAPPGLALRTRVEGEYALVNLMLDDDWAARAAVAPPRLAFAAANGTKEIAWERLEPGQFRALVPLTPGRPLLGAVQVGSQALPFGPIGLPTEAEWATDPARRTELRALAAATGGSERTDLRDVWKAPQPRGELDPTRWLLIAFAVVLVTEALLTQLGVSLLPRAKPAAGAA